MNYYLNVFKIPFIIVLIFLFIILFLILILLYTKYLHEYLEEHQIIRAILGITASILFVGLMIFSLNKITDTLIDGKIFKIFITEKDENKNLTVWFTRTDSPGGFDVYSQRIKSYELLTGKNKGRLDMAKRYFMDDYILFGPFNSSKAWGYSKQNGIKLIDIHDSKLLADQKDIIKQNPELGDVIDIVPGEYKYNSGTNELYIAASNGKIFGISPQLKAVPYKKKKYLKNNTKEKHLMTKLSYTDAIDVEKYGADILNYIKKGYNIYAVLSLKNETFVFIEKKNYTLYAVRIENETGDILEVINYF